jgi:hypothetical protein
MSTSINHVADPCMCRKKDCIVKHKPNMCINALSNERQILKQQARLYRLEKTEEEHDDEDEEEQQGNKNPTYCGSCRYQRLMVEYPIKVNKFEVVYTWYLHIQV